jgi:hypothetical protein
MADVISVTPEAGEPLAVVTTGANSETVEEKEDTSAQSVATGIAIAESEHATETAEDAEISAEVAIVAAEETQSELEEVKFDIGGMEARIIGAVDALRNATERGLLLVAELVDKQPEVKPEPQSTDTPPKQNHFYQRRLWGDDK